MIEKILGLLLAKNKIIHLSTKKMKEPAVCGGIERAGLLVVILMKKISGLLLAKDKTIHLSAKKMREPAGWCATEAQQERESAQGHPEIWQLPSPYPVLIPPPQEELPAHCRCLCGWLPRRGHLQHPGAPPGWLWCTLVQQGPGLQGQTNGNGPLSPQPQELSQVHHAPTLAALSVQSPPTRTQE